MKISRRIHVLDRGRTLTEGSPEQIRVDDRVVAAYLGAPRHTEAQRASR